jgi:glyoxylase I family protein
MTSPPFSIVGLDHVVLRVADLARSITFYCDGLGCSIERQLDAGLTQLRAGAQLIDLVVIGSAMGGTARLDASGRNQDHFCILIDPFDEPGLRQHFLAIDIDVPPSSRRYGATGYGQSVYIDDPDGNVVEIRGR